MHNVGMGAVRVILFTVACLICIPVHVLFISVFYIALGFINIEWFDKLESLLYNNLLFIVGTFVACGKYKVTIIGDDIETIRLEKTLILSNHQSTADVPLFMYIFTEHYRDISKQIMWIMEGLFKFVPFGWVSLWHSDHFLSKKDTIPNIEKHLIKSYRLDRKWYIVFPEGGFFYKHYESNKRYAFRNNLPVLENVILPRTGCLSGILKNEKIKWIVDLTVIYTPETPSFYDMISASKEGNIIIVVKKINIEDVQKSIDSEIFKVENKTKDYMIKLYCQKDEYFKSYKQDEKKFINQFEYCKKIDATWKMILQTILITTIHLMFNIVLYTHFIK